MRCRAHRLGGLLVLMLSMVACDRDRDTPTGPTRPVVPSSPFVGVWSGAMIDSVVGTGTLRLTIAEQVDRSLFGSWSSAFPDASLNDSGAITAFVNATSSALFVTLSSAASRSCQVPAAPATIAANLTVEGNRMAGDFTALGCTTVRAGTMELLKN